MNKEFFYQFLNVLKSENSIYNIAFTDGGALQLNKNRVIPFMSSPHAIDFQNKFNVTSDKESILREIELESQKIRISSIQENNFSRYSWNKEYLMSDGSNVKVNSIGILVNDEDYYNFDEFLSKHKDVLEEDAFFEFNKYVTKQDTGTKVINPFNLNADDICLDDIITALSGINRFAGQTKALYDDLSNDFYTVGQHTLAMYEAIINIPEKLGLADLSKSEIELMAKQSLLHEAYEGITGTDLISPFKYATSKNEYKIAENEAEDVLEKIFNFPLMTPELKKIDRMMASTEGYYLVGKSNTDWENYAKVLDKDLLLVHASQQEVKERLIELYTEFGFYKTLDNYKENFLKHLGEDEIYKAKETEYRLVFKDFNISDESLITLVNLRCFGKIEEGDEEIRLNLETGKKLHVKKSGEVYIEGKGESIKVNSIQMVAELEEKMKLDFDNKLSEQDYNQKSNSFSSSNFSHEI